MNPALNYQLISFLLQYPDRRWEEGLPDVKLEIEQITYEPLKEKLVKFVEAVNNSSSTDWLDRYIETFDFGRATNLYVTYLKQGEKRERGMELLQLKKSINKLALPLLIKNFLTIYLPCWSFAHKFLLNKVMSYLQIMEERFGYYVKSYIL